MYCNIIAFLNSKRDGNFLKASAGLFLKIDFHVNKAFKTGRSLFSHLMLMRQNLDDPTWCELSHATTSHKRLPRLDNLGGRLPEVRLYKLRDLF